MSQCIYFWLVGGCNYSAFTGQIYWFFHFIQICSFKITHFPAHLVLCKDTPSVQILCHLWSKDSSGACSVNVDGQACFHPDEVKSTDRWPRSHMWQDGCFMRSDFSVMFDSLQSHGLYLNRLLSPWNFPGNSTRVACHFLLQGIFLTQVSNAGVPLCRQSFYPLSQQGSPLGFTENSTT